MKNLNLVKITNRSVIGRLPTIYCRKSHLLFLPDNVLA